MKYLLDIMLEDMMEADEFFRPTRFWDNASSLILNELRTDTDFENFKSLSISRKMFVPTYEFYYYTKHKKLFDIIFKSPVMKNLLRKVEDVVTGYEQTKTDYKIFLATSSESYPNLYEIDESDIGNPLDSYEIDGRKYSLGMLNYLRGLNFLKQNADLNNINYILELGGGFGTLGEIAMKGFSQSFYLNIDIPPVAAISSYYLSKLIGEENVLTYEKSRDFDFIDVEEISKKYRCAVICPWQLPKLRGDFDLFVNFISFQEMEPLVVKNYINIIQKHTKKYVLTRNSKFGKNISAKPTDVGVIDQVTLDYILSEFNDFELIARDFKIFGEFSGKNISELAILKRKD
ncbi:putative sugar O-methyltransferase [bacterium]|nr:putative sugar O-methyltransferase [bacterium]